MKRRSKLTDFVNFENDRNVHSHLATIEKMMMGAAGHTSGSMLDQNWFGFGHLDLHSFVRSQVIQDTCHFRCIQPV